MEQKTKRPIFLTTIIVCIASFTYELVSNIISIVNILHSIQISEYTFLIINILIAMLLTTSIVLSVLCIPAWNKSEKDFNKKKVFLFIIFATNILLIIYYTIGLFVDFTVAMLISFLVNIVAAVFVMLEIYNNFKILKSQTVDNAKDIAEVKDVEAVETKDEKETSNEETKEVLEETVETEEAVETVEEKVAPKE